jgi:plastocyanin
MRPPAAVRSPLVSLTAAIVTLAACGGGGDGPSTPAGATVSTVTVSLASATLDPGGTTQATVAALDATGREVAGRSATWASSATPVATVDGTGVVTARAAGTAQITATVDGRVGSAALTVRAVSAPKDSVFMPGNSFSPFSVAIKVGQSVAWAFPRDAHNVIFARLPNGQSNPLDILPTTNRVVTRQFDVAGTYPYDCTLHAGMRGEVVVTR